MFDQLVSRVRKVGTSGKTGAAIASYLARAGFFHGLRPSGLVNFVRLARHMGVGPHLALTYHAINSPEHEALVDGHRRLTYEEIEAETNRLAHALASLGASSGDRVGIMLPNCVEHIICQETLPRMGATAVQIGYRLLGPEIAHIFDNSDPEVVIHHYDYSDVIAEAAEQVGGLSSDQLVVVGAPADAKIKGHRYEEILAEQRGDRPPARGRGGGGVIIYTSGTTGKPKGATRSWKDTGLESVMDLMDQIDFRPIDRHLVVCPLYHSGAMAFAKMITVIGGTVVLAPHFDAEKTLAAIERERITSAFMVPTMLVRILSLDEEIRRKYDTSSLRWIACGAAPLATDTARHFQQEFGPILWNFYGATETGLVSLAGPPDHMSRPGTVGRLLRGNEIRVLDDDGAQLRPGDIGELYARNAMIIGGYHKNAEATSKSMREGFFSVGDLARVDADGYLYIESRKHDMVISGGVNIYPREIEDHLHTHPEIIEAAIIGVPHPEWGESLKAIVVRKPGSVLDESAVIAFCRESLAGYKQPRSVAFIDVLPRNPTGKVLKRELRDI